MLQPTPLTLSSASLCQLHLVSACSCRFQPALVGSSLFQLVLASSSSFVVLVCTIRATFIVHFRSTTLRCPHFVSTSQITTPAPLNDLYSISATKFLTQTSQRINTEVYTKTLLAQERSLLYTHIYQTPHTL